MNKQPHQRKRLSNLGQSLVEVAIFLPVFIFIIAGLVEVSNLLNTQNRVTTASRMAAGFGAANFNPDDWPTTADSMGVVALNTVTETMALEEERWDIWSIHALTNKDGTDFEVFTHTHVYGGFQVVSELEWAAEAIDIRADMLSDLQTWPEGAKDLEVVASVPFHNMDDVLGLPVWQWTGFKSVRGLTVMRVGQQPPFKGCPILPITIRLHQYSLYPTNWEPGVQLNPSLYPGDPVTPFPAEDVWSYPQPKKEGDRPAPIYIDKSPEITNSLNVETFVANRPGVPLADATAGNVYWAREIVDPEEEDATPIGNFGWLSWRGNTDSPTLIDSLRFPGNFIDPETGYPWSGMDLSTDEDPPCPAGDCGNGDHWLVIGEWVANAAGHMNSSGVLDALREDYVDPERAMFLLIYDEHNGQTGENLNYQVAEFAKVRLIGWKFEGNEKWIVFEFLSWGIECHAPNR